MTYYKYYHYEPSLAAACILAISFGLSAAWHVWLMYRHKTWYFTALIVGGIFEIVGYAARAISNSQAPNLTIAPYIIQTLLILLAPALFVATIYMTLGRIIVSMDGEKYSIIKRKWSTKIFVISDVFTFFVQLGGGGLMASSHKGTAQIGSHIVLAGLLVQIIIFAFFIFVAFIFHRRVGANLAKSDHEPQLPWQKFMYLLYITSAGIMIRSIVRVAEFVEGFEGTIILHEVFLYCFDALPMLAVIVVFNIWYPSCFAHKRELWKTGSNTVSQTEDVEFESR